MHSLLDIWLEALQAPNNQYDFFFNNLFGKDFWNKSFTTCFTSSLPSKLPVFVSSWETQC